jgi:hypothetical protein
MEALRRYDRLCEKHGRPRTTVSAHVDQTDNRRQDAAKAWKCAILGVRYAQEVMTVAVMQLTDLTIY